MCCTTPLWSSPIMSHNLGAELTSKLTWATNINKMCAMAIRNLSFLKRDLRISTHHIKEIAYKGQVQPAMECCSPLWNPHQQKYIYLIEIVPCRATQLTGYHILCMPESRHCCAEDR